VYDLLEVKTEVMFDNGKGRMIQRTDFLVREGMRENLVRARSRASRPKSGSRGGGSGEWRVERKGRVNYGMKIITREFVSSSR